MSSNFTKGIFSPDLTKFFNPRIKKIFQLFKKAKKEDELEVPYKPVFEEVIDIPEPIFGNIEDRDSERCKNMFTWVDNDTFRVITDHGVEVEYNLIHQEAETYFFSSFNKEEKWILEEVGFTTVPYFNKESLNEYHFFEEPEALGQDDTIKRLRRKYHAYKRATLIRHFDDVLENPELEEWKNACANEAGLLDLETKQISFESQAGVKQYKQVTKSK